MLIGLATNINVYTSIACRHLKLLPKKYNFNTLIRIGLATKLGVLEFQASRIKADIIGISGQPDKR